MSTGVYVIEAKDLEEIQRDAAHRGRRRMTDTDDVIREVRVRV